MSRTYRTFRNRKRIMTVKRIVEASGASVTFEKNGMLHIYATISFGDRSETILFSEGNPHVDAKIAKDVRRVLIALGALVPEAKTETKPTARRDAAASPAPKPLRARVTSTRRLPRYRFKWRHEPNAMVSALRILRERFAQQRRECIITGWQ